MEPLAIYPSIHIRACMETRIYHRHAIPIWHGKQPPPPKKDRCNLVPAKRRPTKTSRREMSRRLEILGAGYIPPAGDHWFFGQFP